MTNSRDARNWKKGYNEALLDIYNAILEGGEEAALEWIRNNNNGAEEAFEAAHTAYFNRPLEDLS